MLERAVHWARRRRGQGRRRDLGELRRESQARRHPPRERGPGGLAAARKVNPPRGLAADNPGDLRRRRTRPRRLHTALRSELQRLSREEQLRQRRGEVRATASVQTLDTNHEALRGGAKKELFAPERGARVDRRR